MPIQIDGIDAKILNIIQKDAAISVADIADEVGLSSSPCWSLEQLILCSEL